jgi:hypothetical protein
LIHPASVSLPAGLPNACRLPWQPAAFIHHHFRFLTSHSSARRVTMMNEDGRQFLGKLGVDSVDSLSQEQVSDIMEKCAVAVSSLAVVMPVPTVICFPCLGSLT